MTNDTQKGRVYEAVVSYGALGCICSDLVDKLKEPHESVSARMKELRKEGLIKRTGERRLTPRNTESEVHVAV